MTFTYAFDPDRAFVGYHDTKCNPFPQISSYTYRKAWVWIGLLYIFIGQRCELRRPAGLHRGCPKVSRVPGIDKGISDTGCTSIAGPDKQVPYVLAQWLSIQISSLQILRKVTKMWGFPKYGLRKPLIFHNISLHTFPHFF